MLISCYITYSLLTLTCDQEVSIAVMWFIDISILILTWFTRILYFLSYQLFNELLKVICINVLPRRRINLFIYYFVYIFLKLNIEEEMKFLKLKLKLKTKYLASPFFLSNGKTIVNNLLSSWICAQYLPLDV